MPLDTPPPTYLHPSQVPKFVRILYPNGKYNDFPTCEEAEEHVKSTRWEFFWDRQHFRETVASETMGRSWGELEIDTDGNSRDFLQEMERAGYFNVGFHYYPEGSDNDDPNAARTARDLPSDGGEPKTEDAAIW